ncbi:32874_t:CDS:2, partial [Racocetra persica]
TKPQWFFKKLKDLGKIKEKLLELPITDPFYCFIVNFNNLAFKKYNPNFEPSPQIELNSNLEDLYQNYCKQIMKSCPEHPAKYIVEQKRWHHQPLFGLSSSAFNQAQEYFNDIEVTEENIIFDEIINKENETNYLQPIGNSESYYDDIRVYPRKIQLILLHFNSEKLRFSWLAREEIIPTSFENHDVESIIEIYLIVKEIMKENYEVILKIIQEIERNFSQERSIQSIEYLKKVI